MAQLIVVSDTHLEGPQDPVAKGVLNLLEQRARPGDDLVLAGDIFDLYVGDKPVFRDRYQDLVAAIHTACSRGARVHFIEGNHDFLISGVFRGLKGLHYHSRSVDLQIDGRRFLIEHGDLANPHDYGYRALRAFFRSPAFRLFVAASPGNVIEGIGTKLRQSEAFRGAVVRKSEDLARLRKAYRSYAASRIAEGYDHVVLGHCHDLDEMTFVVDGRKGQYINVGYPRLHKSYLVWTAGDERITREPLLFS